MPTKPNIAALVVDGHRQSAEVIRAGLRELGVEIIHFASESERAIEMARAETYRLVIVDSEIAGLSLIDALRGVRKDASAAYILLSNDANPSTLLAAKDRGISGFLLKPYSLATLKRVFGRALTERAQAA